MKKILVIEEQPHTRNLFLKGLKAKGFQTISAENGRVGVQQAREQRPDLITCGIVLSEFDGYTVLATLRQDPITAVVPFIFVSTNFSRDDLRKAMEMGANDYLTKPCTVEELARAIDAQLAKQTVLQQWYTTQPQREPGLVLAETTSNAATSTTNAEPIFSSEPLSDEVFRFIEANYQRSITLSDVAQAVGYSPAYLTNLIKKQTGQPIQRWIIERRMAAARSLLLETDKAIEQIATQVGYQHTVHFFRQFRKIHGLPPQAWRSANRQALPYEHRKNG